MKKIICLVIYISLFCVCNLKAQSWAWEVQGYSNFVAPNEGWSIAIDKQNNFYEEGDFWDSLRFDHITLRSIGSYSNYLVKFDSNGGVLWAKQSTGSSSFLAGTGVATDDSSNSYVCGYFNGNISFGLFNLNSVYGNYDIYLVKYSPSGNVMWAKQSSIPNGHCSGEPSSVAVDDSGNVIVTGYYEDTISFGPYTFTCAIQNVFLAKYSSNGILRWGTAPTQPSIYCSANASAVATDLSGNSFITGIIADTLSFGANSVHSNANSFNIFIAKYDNNGNPIWAKQGIQPSSTSSAQGGAIGTDRQGNIYASGSFTDTTTVGSFMLSQGINAPPYNVFIAKYDPNGNVVWATQSHTLDSTYWNMYAIAIDKNKSIYITGGTPNPYGYYPKMKFGNDTLSTNTYEDPSFIEVIDSSGIPTCGSMLSSGGDDNNGIAVSLTGKFIFFGGDLMDTVRFGPRLLGDTDAGPEYSFVARWLPCGESTAGISNYENTDPVVKIFPNPNNGRFTIKSSVVSDQLSVVVYNILGEKVYSNSFTMNNSPFAIDMSSQPNGIYLYRVITETGQMIGDGKVMIQK